MWGPPGGEKRRILSGMRPTARLHLGNLEGALRLWTELQHEQECFFLIADWHALTTGYQHTDRHRALVREMALDWFAAGLDPKASVIFVQSDVRAHAELALLLSMITPVPWLERSVTYKEWLSDPEVARTAGLGLLGYPVLQAADILLYRATAVPVGKDQSQHIEMTRDIAGRFNHLFEEVFPEPEALHSEHPILPGTDGRKMSATQGNAIYLGDPAGVIERKVSSMFTDPAKVYKGDKGHPERCPVFALHGCYNRARLAEIRDGCSSGALGCVECKTELAGAVVASLAPFRRRREALAADPGALKDILEDGARKARGVSEETLARVRDAMGLWPRAT